MGQSLFAESDLAFGGVIETLMQLSRLVLPAPFGPMIEVIRPY
jgi:hypothetical protein